MALPKTEKMPNLQPETIRNGREASAIPLVDVVIRLLPRRKRATEEHLTPDELARAQRSLAGIRENGGVSADEIIERLKQQK